MKSKVTFFKVIIITLVVIYGTAVLWLGVRASQGRLYPKIENETPQGEYGRFLDALAVVESGGNPKAIGDGGRAVGLFQIWKIYLDDANRILGRPEFSYADRLDPDKSRMIVEIYLGHYATENRLGRPVTYEDKARIHNGGPNGWRKESTKKYWKKVKRKMR